ncbi:hypothetical protein AB3S75_001261 [Citrus x aurantiifolia]
MSGNSNSGCSVYIEIADYAIKLFSGIVTLYNRTLRFALSGQDKNAQNSPMTTTPLSSRKSRSDPVPMPVHGMELSHHSMRISGPRHYSSEEPPPPRVTLETNGDCWRGTSFYL